MIPLESIFNVTPIPRFVRALMKFVITHTPQLPLPQVRVNFFYFFFFLSLLPLHSFRFCSNYLPLLFRRTFSSTPSPSRALPLALALAVSTLDVHFVALL